MHVAGPKQLPKQLSEAMKDGDVVLLQNTRYRGAEETKNGEEFSKELASLADVFVNDAFGTAHRAHCSNVGVTKFISAKTADVVGYLMQKEINFLGNAVRQSGSSVRCNPWRCKSSRQAERYLQPA